jgi:hypothetical protein
MKWNRMRMYDKGRSKLRAKVGVIDIKEMLKEGFDSDIEIVKVKKKGRPKGGKKKTG